MVLDKGEKTMTRRYLSTGSSFEKQASYSRAVIDGEWIFISGTTGYDYKTMGLPENVGKQTQNALATIEASLKQVGASLRDIVRVRYYVTERANIEMVFSVIGAVFADIRPAATMIVCDLIEPDMKIEIEVTARVPTLSNVD